VAVKPPTANFFAPSNNSADIVVNVTVKEVQQLLWKIGCFLSFDVKWILPGAKNTTSSMSKSAVAPLGYAALVTGGFPYIHKPDFHLHLSSISPRSGHSATTMINWPTSPNL
jgi:hypothetical protein